MRTPVIFAAINVCLIFVVIALMVMPGISSIRHGHTVYELLERRNSTEVALAMSNKESLQEELPSSSLPIYYEGIAYALNLSYEQAKTHGLKQLSFAVFEPLDMGLYLNEVLYEVRVRGSYEGNLSNLLRFVYQLGSGKKVINTFTLSVDETARLDIEFTFYALD